MLSQLREAREAGDSENVQTLISNLFDDDSVSGRRGVKPLSESLALVKRKMADKVRK